jgi:hypothetical protein
MGALPSPRIPPNVSLDSIQMNLFAANAAGVDFYTSLLIDGRVHIEHHSHMPEPERTIEAVHSLLCAVQSENDWMTE